MLQGLEETTGFRWLIESLKSKKWDLVDLLGRTAQGAVVRSRFLDVTRMDAQSQFFFNLEKEKLPVYADDVIVLVNKERGIDLWEKNVSLFGLISSATVNWMKPEAVIVEKWFKDQLTLPEGLALRKGGLKYLGVFVGNEQFLQE